MRSWTLLVCITSFVLQGSLLRAQGSPPANDPWFPPSAWAALDPEFAQVLPELKERMVEGLTRAEPYSSGWYTRAGGSLFLGSYDWHSNVIAHWALLTIARLEGDADLSTEVAGRLHADALSAERELLGSLDHSGRGTFPYDQAWLLMLLRELEHHAPIGDLGEIDALRTVTEELLLDWLEAQPLPELPARRSNTQPRYCGFYRSWLFSHLLTSWSEPLTEGATETLARLREERIEQHRDRIVAQVEPHPFDFLWVPAVMALVDRSAPLPGEDHPYPLQEFPPLPESVTLRDVHVVGLEISKLWPYAWDAHVEVAGARAAYQSRLKEILARRDLWADDFTVVSHWVPQYVWITLWLALGRP